MKSTKQTKPWFRRHPILSIFGALLLGLGVYLAVSSLVLTFQIRQEKKKFTQAKTDIDGLYADIVASVGQPAQHESLAYCSYTSVEFGRGARSCDVEELLLIKKTANNNEFEIVKMINQAITSDEHFEFVRDLDSLPQDNGLNYAEIASKEYLNNQLDCSISFTNVTAIPLPYGFSNLNIQNLGVYVQLNCSKNAKAEYFPIRTN